MQRRPARGFTLLEVLVALAIVALGMAALMAALTSAADATTHLRNKSFAEWVALNRVAEIRVAKVWPSEGKVRGTTELGGMKWRWTQTIAPAGLGQMMRVDVSVSLADGSDEKDAAQLAMASGFFSNTVQLNNGTGQLEDWDGASWRPQALSQQQAQKPPTGGTPSPSPAPPPATNPDSRL